MSRRIDRVNGLLRREISQILLRQIKDPRLRGVISITQVRTSGDLRAATVFLSVMGDAEAKRTALEGVQSAAPFLWRELRESLDLRHVPSLRFVLDESIEKADQLLQLMNRIKNDQPSTPGEEGQGPGEPASSSAAEDD